MICCLCRLRVVPHYLVCYSFVGRGKSEGVNMPERMLPELIPGDLFATPPHGQPYQFAADLLNAQTFHWGLVVHSFLPDGKTDYEIMEAIPTKGVSVGLLSKLYGDAPIRIYRVMLHTRRVRERLKRRRFLWPKFLCFHDTPQHYYMVAEFSFRPLFNRSTPSSGFGLYHLYWLRYDGMERLRR